MTFDPDAAATGDGIFGLPFSRAEAAVILTPVPFDATTSYGGGCCEGPAAIKQASLQVDLQDHQFGPIYERGIYMERPSSEILDLSRRARALAAPIIERGGAGADDTEAVRQIDEASVEVERHVYAATVQILDEGKLPGLVGGDHSTPLGAIKACAERFGREKNVAGRGGAGLGVLQIDAHMDLRPAFEGFRHSHASIMYNVLAEIPEVTRLVQIGIRDYSRGEYELMKAHTERISTQFDLDWHKRMEDERVPFGRLCEEAIDGLPQHIYISFDIDGLDPSLCPHTGTPVPGGLSFNRACTLIEAIAHSGRTVVGFDLVEVAPGPNRDEPEWDANVGARILYKLCALGRTR